MKKYLIVLWVFLLQGEFEGQAQNSASINGISVVVSTGNDNTFYYGEPFKVFLEIKNTQDALNPYYKPLRGVNLNYFLKQNSSSQVLSTGPNYWQRGASSRAEMMTARPSNERAYQPYEEGFYAIEVNADFGYESITKKPYGRGSELGYRMLALPVGQYELIVDYYLMPSDKKITVSFPFEIVPVPAQEQEAYQAYVESAVYASSAHRMVNNNYAASNPNSYENFIKKHPNSVFAHYAFFDMVGQVYYYGFDKTALQSKYKEYVNYYPRLRKSSQKMMYVQSLPYIFKHIPGKDPQKEADAFLYKIKDENPALSKVLLLTAEKVHKIKGLKNYSAKGNGKG